MKLFNLLRKKYSELIILKRQYHLNSLISRGLKIGRNVKLVDKYFFDPSHCYLISIGDNCTICPDVRLIAHDASTKAFLGYTKLGRIDIENNCFIGDSVIILPNVSIGPESIVGAGSVVTKSIPARSVAAGNPAKVICSLDNYLNKIKTISSSKRIFVEEEFIGNLDEEKRKEVIKSVGDSIGFII